MKESLNICMISDFFCPNTGGVESHIYYLASCLSDLGHHVVVITHCYGKRCGVYVLNSGIKVYYLPFIEFYNSCVLPTIFTALPFVRHIILTEQIHVVHGHSSFSTLAHESMFHAQMLGIPTVFTDHSLFGFADPSSIITNQLLKFSLTNCNHVICVSHTSKENTVLRADLNPTSVSVIPNAVNCDVFVPPTHEPSVTPIVVVVMSRLVYRKGMDLLASVIPRICSDHPDVRFIIGGDGPKRIVLEEMREQNGLQERVDMLGAVPHTDVQSVLCRGHIFLNTSLTEAFCMAIVEAASCGLHVVSTCVGGVPEVLPPDLIDLARPSTVALTDALSSAICRLRSGEITLNRRARHRRVREMYSWPLVAYRTQLAYERALADKQLPWSSFFLSYLRCGIIGIFFMTLAVINSLFVFILDVFSPIKRNRNAKRCPAITALGTTALALSQER